MDWKQLFTNTTIVRGRNYYKEGRVRNLTIAPKGCTATVIGRRKYTVVITAPGKESMVMRCGCPQGELGAHCKHMAAVLFAWEKKEREKPIVDVRKQLFLRSEDGGEPYYDISAVTSDLIIPEDAAEKAKEFIAEKRLDMGDFTETLRKRSSYNYGRSLQSVRVRGRMKENGAEYPLEMNFDRKKMIDYDCSACGDRYYGRFYGFNASDYKKVCAHMTGLLILADEYIRTFDPGDSTDYDARLFLNAFDKEKVREIASERSGDFGNVVLEPKIVDTGIGHELNFKIGNDGKMFVVKNLTELYDTVDAGGEYKLGKSRSINFTTEHFDEKSGELYALIAREVKRGKALEQKMESRRTYQYGGTLETGKGVPLVGDVMDTLYHQMVGEPIEYKGIEEKKSGRRVIRESDPVVDMILEIKSYTYAGVDKLDSISVTGQVPRIIEGVKGNYFISDQYISKLSDEAAAHIRPFDEIKDGVDHTFEFIIGRKEATNFYYKVLPVLRDDPMFRIEERGKIAGLIQEEAEFDFFLDAENGRLLCEAQVRYGAKEDRLRPIGKERFPLDAYRDIAQERPVVSLLDELFEEFQESADQYIIENDEDAAYELMRSGIDRLIACGNVHSTDAFSAVRIRRTPVVQIGVRVSSNLLDIQVLSDDVAEEELIDILESYKRKKKYHRLRSGQFVDLEDNVSLDTVMNIMGSTNVSMKEFAKGHFQIPVYRALYIDQMLEGHEELVFERDKKFRNLVRDFKTINEADFEVPDSLKKIVRPYQEKGYKWIRTLEKAGFGGILADDMGLGKTLQMIAALLASKEEGKELKALVVCPASVVYNWVEEVNKFAPQLVVTAVSGTKKERKEILCHTNQYHVLVTSYDLLKRDIDLYEGISFTHQVIDEAQFIKNAKALASKTVKLIDADHRFALTGTPIENRLSELWSIFDYLMPGFLYHYERFRKEFEIPISKNGDETVTERLRYLISPFLLRRRKRDVLKDLPEKLEEIRYAHFDEKQEKLYDGQVVKIKGMLEADEYFDGDKIRILAELTKIRQICCDPALLFEEYDGGSAKREACLDLVKSAIDGGHKILLFSQFTSMLDRLEQDLIQDNISYYKLVGATPKKERQDLAKKFNMDDTQVFLVSLKAGGTGLNLTGADIVIHYDPWWNTAAQDQATDRAHRIGQENQVTVYRIIAKDTIEEKIVALQETKKELADAVLSGEARSIGSMSREELLALLDV